MARRRARRGLPPPQVHVATEDFTYSCGEVDLPFHVASVGKLATAAVVMGEVERGNIRLDTRVSDILPGDLIRSVFTGPAATVGHLLMHTSERQITSKAPSYRGAHFCKRSSPIRSGSGSRTNSSNSASIARSPSATPVKNSAIPTRDTCCWVAFWKHVPEGTLRHCCVSESFIHHMADSVLWLREDGPEAIAPPWIDGQLVSSRNAMGCDWAGGGIVTTARDLTSFLRAWGDGTVISEDGFAAMVRSQNPFRRGIDYGCGAMRVCYEEFFPLLQGIPHSVGHIGVSSVHGFIEPRRGSTIVLNFHDSRVMTDSFRSHIRIAQGLTKLA